MKTFLKFILIFLSINILGFKIEAHELKSIKTLDSLEDRIEKLENELKDFSKESKKNKNSHRDYASKGVVLLFIGTFCALWAQNTDRNPWIWFFLGLIFNIIMVLVILSKNSMDIKLKKLRTDL